MNIDNTTILTRGANRGIGRAMGEKTLRRSVSCGYAGPPAAENGVEDQRRTYVPSMH